METYHPQLFLNGGTTVPTLADREVFVKTDDQEVHVGTESGTPFVLPSKQKTYYLIDSGAANTIIVTVPAIPALTSWTQLDGIRLAIKIKVTNTGATTIAVTGLTGTKNVKKFVSVALVTNDLLTNGIYEFIYDVTQDNVQALIGKGLSTEDFTTAEKNKLDAATATPGASVIPIADANAKLDAWITAVPDGTTSVKGKVQLQDSISAEATKALTPNGVYAEVTNPLKTNLLNSWQAGGKAIVSSAVDVVLTSASKRVQDVVMTATEQSMLLPDATTISEGGPIFFIKNSGANTFYVRTLNGEFVTMLSASQRAIVWCEDNSTADGKWIVSNNNLDASVIPFFGVGTADVWNATASIHLAVAMWSPTKAIVVFNGTSNYLQAVVLTISNSTILNGNVATINATASQYMSLDITTSSQAVCTYIDSTNSYIRAVVLNSPATTITYGAILQIAAKSYNYTCTKRLTDTKVIISYNVNCAVLTVGGDYSLTSGTPVGTAFYYAGLVVVSPTVVIIGHSNWTYFCATKLAINGNAITIGDAYTTAYNCNNVRGALLDANTVVFAVQLSTDAYLQTFDISGATPAPGTKLTVRTGDNNQPVELSVMSATQVMVVVTSSSRVVYYYYITISSGVCSKIQTQTGATLGAAYLALARVTATRALQVSSGASSYGNASMLEHAL